MEQSTVILAALIGFISAVSLPAGAVLGFFMKPGKKTVSALMAFGGGALLFALTIEIVAHAFHIAGFYPLAAGCVIGGLLYEALNQILNSRGAFGRKASTFIKQFTQIKRKNSEKALSLLAGVSIFKSLPPEQIARLIPHITAESLKEGATVFEEGAAGDSLYIIDEGSVEIARSGEIIKVLKEGEVFGEMALLTDRPRVAKARTLEDTKLLRMSKKDFMDLLALSPEVRNAVERLKSLREEELSEILSKHDEEAALEWKNKALRHLHKQGFAPSGMEIDRAIGEHGGSALGIWLGIFLDGIPESITLGLSVVAGAPMPYALVAGVFLANLPEAMSSSIIMEKQKYTKIKILLMWGSITFITAAGALLGNAFFRHFHHSFLAGIEGAAAGAMLTMIAETMLPEAYEQGGTIVGLATLAGFLAALFVKSLS